LKNPKGLLKPGMNADVEISIAKRDSVATVPTAALRTNSDIPATAKMLGVDEAELRRTLLGKEAAATTGAHGAQGTITIGGRSLKLPPGVDASKVSALMQKRRDGGTLTAEERDLLRRVFAANGGGRSRSRPPRGFGGPPPGGFEAGPAFRNGTDPKTKVANYQFGGDYWVVAMRNGKTVPVEIRTGLTDLSYTQVVSGLSVGDKVLLLPSASLYEQQTRLQQFISRRVARSSPFGG
jgi:HlyD family secretion protein